MSNNFDSVVEEYWSKKLQLEHFKFNAFKYVANTQYEAALRQGDTFHKSYTDQQDEELAVYTKQTDIAVEDITTTDEALVVNQMFATARQFDKFSDVQNAMNIADEIAPKDAQRYSNNVDYNVLAQVSNAASVVDNGFLSTGTVDGVGIEPDSTNVVEIFAAADRKFTEANIQGGMKKAVICPKLAQAIKEHLAGRDTPVGDKVALDGNMNLKFMGYQLYESNQIMSSAVLSLVTQPSNGNTVVIDGITFTFVSSIGSTSGNVLIGATVDVTRANLAALINAPGTTSATQVGWAATHASYKKLTNRATATNDNSADTLTVTYKGKSSLTVSETLTDTTDTWTSNKVISNNLFVVDNPISLVTQIAPMVEITPAPLQFSRYVKRGVLYGLKTWREDTFKMVNVKTK